MIRVYQIGIAVIISIAISCNKKEAPAKPISERTRSLTTGQWVMREHTEGGVSNYNSIPACLRDNYHIYKTDGSSESNEGPTKCDPSNSQVIKGDWRFDENETVIWLDGGLWDIVTLSSTTFKISTQNILGGIVEVTFTH